MVKVSTIVAVYNAEVVILGEKSAPTRQCTWHLPNFDESSG